MGQFHPHGDQSIYDALVRLTQDFAQRYPLIDGQGNFGNIDGDNAAAMRYTECRLTEAAQLLLDLNPDLMVAAHFGAMPFVREDIEKALDRMQECYGRFQRLFPWDDPNFGLDPLWVRTYPYRQVVFKGGPVTLEARIYNHSGTSQKVWAELRVPEGWKTSPASPVNIPPHSEGSIQLTGVAPVSPARNREVLGVVIRFGDRMLGEIGEAVIDYFE